MNAKQLFSFLVLFLLSVISVNAQWQTNGTNVYYNNGNVGIGTASPTQKLNVAGKIAIAPAGVYSEENYNGRLTITNAQAGGQYINLIRSTVYPWSIGMVYNTHTFAIGTGKKTDSEFTNPEFVINVDGNVGIGRTTPMAKLDVNGTIRAKEIKVESTGADFVFEEDYELPSLEEVENHIKEKKHLPGIPSAKEVQEEGMGLAEMNTKLLQKIEELTLYVIQLRKEMDALKISKVE